MKKLVLCFLTCFTLSSHNISSLPPLESVHEIIITWPLEEKRISSKRKIKKAYGCITEYKILIKETLFENGILTIITKPIDYDDQNLENIRLRFFQLIVPFGEGEENPRL